MCLARTNGEYHAFGVFLFILTQIHDLIGCDTTHFFVKGVRDSNGNERHVTSL